MTIRDHLEMRLRRIMALAIGGIALFFAGILIGEAIQQRILLAIALPGFAIAFVTDFLWALFRLSLPSMLGEPGDGGHAGGGFQMDSKIKYCPHCGCGMDEMLG